MNRDQNKTVTDFALLGPAQESQAMGEATFLSETAGLQHVRAITLNELKATARMLRGTEAARFDALLALRDALESNDQLAMNRSFERMAKYYRLRRAETPSISDPELDREIGSHFVQQTGLPAEEAVKYILGHRSGRRAAENPRRLFSYEVSQAVGAPLQSAQAVLWWMDGAFRPAIYCPSATTALYIHTFFLAPGGGLGFRICPYDGDQFFQDRPNQQYCCPAHREAHRMARHRDNKKQKAAMSGERRR